MDNTEPLRVVIHVCVTDIPGHRLARSHRLGRDFCLQVLGRQLQERKQILDGFIETY
jgi:hypothetical protein